MAWHEYGSARRFADRETKRKLLNLINFPDPIAWYTGAKQAGLERDEINAFVSMAYSAWLSFTWRSGTARWVTWAGEGKALQDAATAAYLSLESLQKKNFITLAVPSDLLDAANVSRFQVSFKTK